MIVRRPECMLLHRPTRWENDKIGNRCARLLTLTRQNSEYTRILETQFRLNAAKTKLKRASKIIQVDM